MSGKLLERRAERSGPKDYDHLLDVTDIHLAFKGVKAIAGVSFHVDDGELFAIIGPNGAGKTSLFNVVNQVYEPQQGDVRWKGRVSWGSSPTRRPNVASPGHFRTSLSFPI